MSLFRKSKKEVRSIDDILMPNDENKDLAVEDENSVDGEDVKNIPIGASSMEISPLDCFGMKEEKTEKWLFKFVRIWYYLMSFVWFLFGSATFAPVIFIGNKLNAVFNDKKKSILFALILHIALITLLLVFFYTRAKTSDLPAS